MSYLFSGFTHKRRIAFGLLLLAFSLKGQEPSGIAGDHISSQPSLRPTLPIGQPPLNDRTRLRPDFFPSPAKNDCLASDERSRAWTERQLEVAGKSFEGEPGGLIDQSKFLTPETNARLAQVQTQGDRGIRFVTASTSNGRQKRYYFQTDLGERWNISEQPWYRDQYKNEAPEPQFMIRFDDSKDDSKNPQIAELGSAIDLKSGRVDFAKVADAISKAKMARASELEDPIRIGSWDLPKGPTGYIGLIDGNHRNDAVIGGLVEDVRNFPRMLNEKKGGCDFVGTSVGGMPSDLVEVKGGSVSDTIRNYLNAFENKGISSVYLNIAGHGDEDGIVLTNPITKKHMRLTPNELQVIINEKPKMNLLWNTVACHGGGIASMMEVLKEGITGDPNRVTVFLQSKMSGVNQEGRIAGTSAIPEPYSTRYQVYLTHFLAQKHSYGAAHKLADIRSKATGTTDAEVWRPGVSTKGLTSKPQGN